MLKIVGLVVMIGAVISLFFGIHMISIEEPKPLLASSNRGLAKGIVDLLDDPEYLMANEKIMVLQMS